MKIVVHMETRKNGGYRAWCPALPGCQVLAASADEASRKIEIAIRSYLASLNVALPVSQESQQVMAPAGV